MVVIIHLLKNIPQMPMNTRSTKNTEYWMRPLFYNQVSTLALQSDQNLVQDRNIVILILLRGIPVLHLNQIYLALITSTNCRSRSINTAVCLRLFSVCSQPLKFVNKSQKHLTNKVLPTTRTKGNGDNLPIVRQSNCFEHPK